MSHRQSQGQLLRNMGEGIEGKASLSCAEVLSLLSTHTRAHTHTHTHMFSLSSHLAGWQSALWRLARPWSGGPKR
jgi:hypothetical protein